ncbi:MAG TPA: hypothetical protein VFM97_10210 [Gammaproteobacteria bacterium]|nr:hypothetical protein [Gammaproteobacteria bacterium]
MIKARSFVLLIALGAIAFTPAFAGGNDQTQAKAVPPKPASTAKPAKKNKEPEHKNQPQQLGTVQVNGHKMTPIERLCFLRKAFSEEYSSNPAKADDIICRIHKITGSQFYGMSCMTNKQYFTAKLNNGGDPPSFVSGGIAGKKVRRVSRGTIRELTTNPRIKAVCEARNSGK